MKNNHSLIYGYKVFEYLLVLNPPEDLRNKILQVKRQFHEFYKTSIGINVPAHITLVRFKQYAMAEERIINRLNVIAMGYHPSMIELKDYGSFPSHTIFINITSKKPVQNLVKTIRSQAQLLMKLDKENKPHFIMEPFMPIAWKLQPWQYEQGWQVYSHKQFTGRFIADGMLLLKRPVGEINYHVVQRFEFQNLPVTIKQGALFM